MTVLRTFCPSCDVVRVRAHDATLRQPEGADHVEISFRCPSCAGRVVQELGLEMVPMLLSAGVEVIEEPAPHVEGGITEAEIQAFVVALDRIDWADELAR